MLISIVIPVYREAGNLRRLYQRLEAVTKGMPEYAWEYIFVNDGSPDDSLEQLRRLAADAKVKVIDLSRNFGKEIALTAGVHHAVHADAVICLDADLQHPPEYIPELVARWRAGVEIVATIRVSIEKQPVMRRFGSYLYYWLMAKISEVEMVSQTTDFRLYDRKVVRAFCAMTERQPRWIAFLCAPPAPQSMPTRPPRLEGQESGQGVDPPKSGEPSEVGVVRMDCPAELDRLCRQLGVRREVGPGPLTLKQRQGEPGVRNRTQQRRIVAVSLETMTIVDNCLIWRSAPKRDPLHSAESFRAAEC